MVIESYFLHENLCHHMVHSQLLSHRPTLLIIHGLGDSGASYYNFLFSKELRDYNILIPDLLGYGKSSASTDYSFQCQVTGILKHIDYLQNQQGIESILI
ncbi:MAG: hypothetical protein A3E83_08975 [Gammaproteobacteria bacterium RIFCSPHIGHO2_12_FULL_41_20]|nr:MAG: hypothetical protein A3E83_08975 [Gammaproteobacteria bacterium RIFCSPHIGHO2_12_FULL_41_20]